MWELAGTSVFSEPNFIHCEGGAPLYYPDLQTITCSQANLEEEIGRLADQVPSRDYFVKDSFACLDFRSYGFEILFEAFWIGREANPEKSEYWLPLVQDPFQLNEWTVKFLGRELQETDANLFPQALLDHSEISLIDNGNRGCLVNYQKGLGFGVSNCFGEEIQVYADLVSSQYGNQRLFGYEDSDQAKELISLGFKTLGPLTVWRRPAKP
ncbi:hypothetical protein [Sneathiella limimaris]|uniref:hypothetical protein n=1 Tax=Sneathiella limimaris TaxID=1964213 RepID=UPI00146DAB9F|nr:hypothetical protein [Sneathiella limimaris]